MRDSLNFYLSLAVVVAALPTGSAAIAAPYFLCENNISCAAPGGGGSGDETAVFAGLRWSFGEAAPAIVGGVRYLKSDDGDSAYGAQADVALPLITSGAHLPKVRLLGLFGNTTVQGQLGGGYDFAKDTFILSAGLQSPHLEGGLDYGLDGSFTPYVGVNSLAKPKLDGELSCGNGYTLASVTDNIAEYQSYPVYIDDANITDGQTCISGTITPP